MTLRLITTNEEIPWALREPLPQAVMEANGDDLVELNLTVTQLRILNVIVKETDFDVLASAITKVVSKFNSSTVQHLPPPIPWPPPKLTTRIEDEIAS